MATTSPIAFAESLRLPYRLKDEKSSLRIQVPASLSAPKYEASSSSDSHYIQEDKWGSIVALRTFVESPLSDAEDAPYLASGASLSSCSPPRAPHSTVILPANAHYDGLDTPIYNSAPPPYTSRPSSVCFPGSDGHALALAADELTRRLVAVRRNLTHERRHHSQKLSDHKKTIDIKEDLLVKAYNEIRELKAKDDARSKRISNLETDLARLQDDLVSLREEHHRLEKDSQAQIAVLEDQRDKLFREKDEKIRQLAESSTRQMGLYISNNNIEGNEAAVFTNWVVNMGCTRYLLPFLSPLSFLDQLEEFLSSPYIPLSLLARGSFPGRRGGLHDHGVCVAESGTGLTLLSAQLIDESLRLVKTSFDIQEVGGDDFRILFGEEASLPPDDDSSPNNAVLFTFCGHRNGHATPGLFNITGLFLAILASKLDPSNHVRKRLNMRREHEDQLRREEMEKYLIEVSQSFDHISVFLDAVHKLPEGHLPALLTVLKRMTPRRGVSLFLTRSPQASPQDPVPGTWRFRPKRNELRQFVKTKLLSNRVTRPEAINNRLMHSIANTLSAFGSFKDVLVALDTILEKATANERRLVLKNIPRSSRLRDDVIAHRGRFGKSTFPLPKTLSSQVESRGQTKPIEGRHLESVPHPSQVGFVERTEQIERHSREFRISSGLCALQIQVPATRAQQCHCQGMTPLGERCLKPTPCNLHTRCKGITKAGKPCMRNGPKNGFCFQHG